MITFQSFGVSHLTPEARKSARAVRGPYLLATQTESLPMSFVQR